MYKRQTLNDKAMACDLEWFYNVKGAFSERALRETISDWAAEKVSRRSNLTIKFMEELPIKFVSPTQPEDCDSTVARVDSPSPLNCIVSQSLVSA